MKISSSQIHKTTRAQKFSYIIIKKNSQKQISNSHNVNGARKKFGRCDTRFINFDKIPRRPRFFSFFLKGVPDANNATPVSFRKMFFKALKMIGSG
jgi:hypothetical protein